MPTDFALPDGFAPMKLTADDLTYDEIDEFARITGKELGAGVPRGQLMRALSILGLARHGIIATPEDLGPIPVSKVLDMDYLAGLAAPDPTVAGD